MFKKFIDECSDFHDSYRNLSLVSIAVFSLNLLHGRVNIWISAVIFILTVLSLYLYIKVSSLRFEKERKRKERMAFFLYEGIKRSAEKEEK